MPSPRRNPPRFLGEPMRRKLDVAAAMAWEALVDSHVEQAMQFVRLLDDYEPLEAALPRYLQEMDLRETMGTAVRTRVLTQFEEDERAAGDDLPSRLRPRRTDADDDAAPDEAWSLLRQSQRVMRDVRRRQRRNEEIDRIVLLALARAEENVIETHVENAIGYVALLDGQLTMDRAVQTYLGAIGLAGGRAQTVFQRTMARLADVHLPV